MSQLEKEIKLLKDYIATLEKQNQARNQERNTIFQQIDRLAAQNDRLNDLLSRNPPRQVNTIVQNNNPALEQEFNNLKQALINKLKVIDSLNAKISNHSSQLIIKENEIVKLRSENALLLAENKRLKDTQNKNSTQGNRLLILQNEVSTYRIKINQLQNIENQLKLANVKVIDFENSRRKMESDLRILQAQNRRLSQQYKKLEITNRQLKTSTNLVSSESTTFMSTKLALQATIRQLNSKIQWQQTQSKASQQQRNMIQKRLKDVQRQFQESKSKLVHLKYVEESYKSIQSGISIKQKQMQALQQMINSLKQNKKFLERSLKQKEDIIVTLQAQAYSYKSSSFNNDQYQKELSSLKIEKLSIEKQFYQLKNHCEMLDIQMNKIKQKEESFYMQINSLRAQREQILKDRDLYAYNLEQKDQELLLMRKKNTQSHHYHGMEHIDHHSYGPDRHSKLENSSELKILVEKLREEIEEMKASNQFKSNFYSEIHQNTHDHRHSMSPNANLSMNNLKKNDKSPSKGIHPKIVINNDRSRNDLNKQKWQNLQRKINALRNENQYLKKSLFD